MGIEPVRRGATFAAVLVLSLAVSCSRSPEATGEVDRYLLTGVVVRVDAGNKTVVVKHDPILSANGEVWMDAMTMEFPVRDAAGLGKLREGQRIKAALFQRPSDLDYWLGEIEVDPAGELLR
jgi:Cu/Ag efflux protein CusF